MSDESLGKQHDRPRRRQRHDDEHEQRFRVVDAAGEVIDGVTPPAEPRKRRDQWDRPQYESQLDFAEEVERIGAKTACIWPKACPYATSGCNEPGRGKRVENC